MDTPYVSINDIGSLTFGSCEGCERSCCSGERFVMAPLILEDMPEVYRHFPIVFARIDNEWRMVMLYTDGEGPCRCWDGAHCTIYDERPPACRLYPVNPYYDSILIDTSCPAVGKPGTFLASPRKIASAFYHPRLEDFNAKRLETQAYLETLGEEMDYFGTLQGIDLFCYAGTAEDEYLRMHHASLAPAKR